MKRISIYLNAAALGLALALTLVSTVRAQAYPGVANVTNYNNDSFITSYDTNVNSIINGTGGITVGGGGNVRTWTPQIGVVPLDSSSGLSVALPATQVWPENQVPQFMPSPVRDYSMHADHSAVLADIRQRRQDDMMAGNQRNIAVQVPGLTIRKDYGTLDGQPPRFIVLSSDLIRQGTRLKVWTNLPTVVVGNTGYGTSKAGVTYIEVPDSAGVPYLPWQEGAAER